MDTKQIRLKLADYLSHQSNIPFAYVFGSFVNKDQYRDIDIAVFTKSDIDLIGLGTLQTELASLVYPDEVDVIQLNNLYRKNPSFVYQVLTEGRLLYNNSTDLHTTFKRQALLYYFDTDFLRRQVEQSFTKRLETDNFGMRNYE